MKDEGDDGGEKNVIVIHASRGVLMLVRGEKTWEPAKRPPKRSGDIAIYDTTRLSNTSLVE